MRNIERNILEVVDARATNRKEIFHFFQCSASDGCARFKLMIRTV
jgi:hypothetical protein